MIHVKQIENLIDEDKTKEAEDALENLLSLGPNNTAALKLQAKLCEYKGKFDKELSLWKKIYSIDKNDPEAFTYFQMRQIEDQEHHYFTDQLPGGGQRILTYQRPLLKPMFTGFIGSLSFIIFTHFAEKSAPYLLDPRILIPVFLLAVVSPVFLVIYKFLTTMYFMSLDKDKFSISTRLKSHEIRWQDIENIFIAHSGMVDQSNLHLVILPKNKEIEPIEIDLGKNTTSIRSRPMFIKELAFHFTKPANVSRSELASNMAPLRF
jgi:hypothetical protein